MQESSILNVPRQEVQAELDIPPDIEKVKMAVRKLNIHKIPGVDGIPAEIYQLGGDLLLENITILFQVCWERGELPYDLRNTIIVSLYKNKGEKSDCSNYRGIYSPFNRRQDSCTCYTQQTDASHCRSYPSRKPVRFSRQPGS